MQAVSDSFKLPGESFCPPSATTRAAIVGIVVQHLRTAPELQRESAFLVTYVALQQGSAFTRQDWNLLGFDTKRFDPIEDALKYVVAEFRFDEQ